jgi:hypothetical protein
VDVRLGGDEGGQDQGFSPRVRASIKGAGDKTKWRE